MRPPTTRLTISSFVRPRSSNSMISPMGLSTWSSATRFSSTSPNTTSCSRLARRVLCPDGVFVISTPDREIYSEAADYHNPYHVKELSLREFDELLGRFFSHHALWGQIVTIGSTLERIDRAPGAGSPDEIFVRQGRRPVGASASRSGPLPGGGGVSDPAAADS